MKAKTIKIIYWTTTTIIFLFDCAIPAFTSNSDLAKEALRHLQYPDYFGPMLTFFKVIGGLLLILPMVPARFKEWAYFGFGASMACASVSYFAVDGVVFFAFFPWIFIGILAVSYTFWHKLLKLKGNESAAA
jgi:hypothetical protein